MKRLFICLANSKKYGERCIAGIEVTKNESGGFTIIRNGDNPKWIRPVANTQHGEVPEALVKSINLLDVVELEVIQDCPQGYQSENVLFRSDSLKQIAKIRSSTDNLDLLIDATSSKLFGNRGKAVSSDIINSLAHSLVLIKSTNVEVYERTEYEKLQVRIKFEYNNTMYDLPVTDVIFLENYKKNIDTLENANCTFICVSLGVEYEQWHYKLAAGIICI